MSYCRYCGIEISYKRTKNDKWVPCNAITGEPHFCQEQQDNKACNSTGITPCPECGKPVFIQLSGRKKIKYDYTTLLPHVCKAGDVTRFRKYQERNTKLEAAKPKPKVRLLNSEGRTVSVKKRNAGKTKKGAKK